MISLVHLLVRGYEWLVPPPEPQCCHGLGIALCAVCGQSPGFLPGAGCVVGEAVPPAVQKLTNRVFNT